MAARDQIINVRVSPEEKAVIKKAAGAGGIGPYLRALGLAQANGLGPRTGASGRDAEPQLAATKRSAEQVTSPQPSPAGSGAAPSWRARVNQLQAQGVPRPAAERVADLEFRG